MENARAAGWRHVINCRLTTLRLRRARTRGGGAPPPPVRGLRALARRGDADSQTRERGSPRSGGATAGACARSSRVGPHRAGSIPQETTKRQKGRPCSTVVLPTVALGRQATGRRPGLRFSICLPRAAARGLIDLGRDYSGCAAGAFYGKRCDGSRLSGGWHSGRQAAGGIGGRGGTAGDPNLAEATFMGTARKTSGSTAGCWLAAMTGER